MQKRNVAEDRGWGNANMDGFGEKKTETTTLKVGRKVEGFSVLEAK